MQLIFQSTWRKGFLLSATFLFTLLLGTACKKDSNIGQNSIDQNELLASGAVDTFDIITYSVYKDSIISKNPLFGLLGSYNDPEFGGFNAEIYTQIRLSGFTPNFGDLSTVTIDSMVLALEYGSSYGKKGIQYVEVHELDAALNSDSSYYSNSTIPVKTNFGANNGDWVKNGKNAQEFNVNKLTVIGNDTISSSQLRIPLSITKAKELMIAAQSGMGYYDDNDAFIAYFNGLRIRTVNGTQASGDGGVFYFSLTDPDSKMTIYYHENGVAKTFDFLINSSCTYFNHVDLTPTAQIDNALYNPTAGEKYFYAQSYGNRAAIEIPGISNIPTNSVIHKAVLELPVSYHFSSPYTPGFNVSLSTPPSLTSDLLYSVGYGTYSESTKKVTADIRAYVQDVVSGNLENTRLVISPALFNTTAERIIFNGAQSGNKLQPKVYILYTEF